MDNTVCVSFYLRRSTIHLHQSTVRGINSPAFVRLLVNVEKNTFAVLSCAKKDLSSIRVRIDQTGKIDRAEIHSQLLCRTLAQINDWDINTSYRVYGKAFPSQNVAVFSFTSSEKISDEEERGSLIICED